MASEKINHYYCRGESQLLFVDCRMRLLMGAEMATLGAAKAALVAGKRLLARVRPLMGAERTARGAAIVALLAGKRLLARVQPPMGA